VRDLIALRLRERRTAQALRRTRRQPIRSVLNYQITKITGHVHLAEAAILAPLTGRSCAYYSVSVEHLGELIVLDEDGADFLLDDGTGRAIVHARSKQTRVILHKDSTTHVGPLDKIDRELDAFLRWHRRVQHKILGLPQSLVFREGVLEAGELATACGVGVWQVDPDLDAWSVGYRDFPRRLALGPLPDGGLHVSDEPEFTR
jgi:hypothetical protein